MNVKKALSFFAQPNVQTLDEQLAAIKAKAAANLAKLQKESAQDGFQKTACFDDLQPFSTDKLELRNKPAANRTGSSVEGIEVEEVSLKDLPESERQKFIELFSATKGKTKPNNLNTVVEETLPVNNSQEILKNLKTSMPPMEEWELVPKD